MQRCPHFHIGADRYRQPGVRRIVRRRRAHRIELPIPNIAQPAGIIHQAGQVARPDINGQLNDPAAPLHIFGALPNVPVQPRRPRGDAVGNAVRVGSRKRQTAAGRVGGKSPRQLQVDGNQRRRYPIVQTALRRFNLLNVGPHFGNALFNLNNVRYRCGVLQQHNQPFLLCAPGFQPRRVVNQPVGNISGSRAFIQRPAQSAQRLHRLVQPFRRRPHGNRRRAVAALPV